jgi:putative membrane protein
MTVAMAVLNGAPPWARRKSLPPRQITMRLAADADTHPERWPETVRKGATAVSHLAYGVGAAAGYGVMAHRLPGDTITRGTAFGLALWGVSYAGWLPATGVRRPPTAQPSRVEALMIAVHLVYGVTLGLVHDWLTRDTATRQACDEPSGSPGTGRFTRASNCRSVCMSTGLMR